MDLSRAVNLKTVIQNIKISKSQLNKGVRFCAVVKANAYSMGDIRISNAIQKHVDMFAVARMSEAVSLREGGISKPILLFGVCEDYQKASQYNIIVTIGSLKEMYVACRMHGKLNIHIKVNTGMNRFGITTPWHLRNVLSLAAKNKNVNVCGLYTHFSHECTTEKGCLEIDNQLSRFAPYRAIFRRTHPDAIIHAACSGSAKYRPAQFDMVRIGKSMYGGFEGFKAAVTITAKIIAVQHLPKSQTVGYGGRFQAQKNMIIGIISCGYAVAGFLAFGHTTHLYIDKKPYRILGTVCMDTLVIDISELQDPIGKSVIITGDSPGSRIIDFVNQSGISGATYLCSLRIN